MAFLSKYGAARHIYVPMIKRGAVDFAVSADWTPAAGDVKISKDGGTAANVTNLPAAITMGNTAMWDFSLTATEMQAAQIHVTVADSSTKAVEDTMFIVETYGNASAQHAVDLSDSVRAGLTALPNATAGASSGLHINGSNGGTTTYGAMTITGALTVSDGIAVTRSTSNSSAITATGNGTGSGIVATSGSGATGDGMKAVAASTNGNGLTLTKTGTGKDFNATSTPLTLAKTTNITGFNDIASAAQTGDAMTLTSAYDAAKTASQAGDIMKLSSGTGANQISLSSGAVLLQATQTGVTIPTVTTLTNAPSDSSGVTTLLSRLSATRAGYLDNLSGGAVALASKLKRYVQLLARKDAAIATDAATELGEINENVASGAGTFDNTTDAEQALRDRGDAAWVTATGFAVPGDAMALVNDAFDALAVADSGSAEIAAAIQSAAATAPIAVDVKKINATTINGTGVLGDEFGP